MFEWPARKNCLRQVKVYRSGGAGAPSQFLVTFPRDAATLWIDSDTGNVWVPYNIAPDSDPSLIDAWAWANLNDGRSDAEINALIASGVEDWAEAGNEDPIPAEKLTNASGDSLPDGGTDGQVLTSDGSGGAAWESLPSGGGDTHFNASRFQGAGSLADPIDIEAGGIGTSQIAGGAVTSAKIAQLAVTNLALANNAVTAAKINGGAVSLAKLAAAVAARLLPTGGTDGQVLTLDGSTPAWEAAADGDGGAATPNPVAFYWWGPDRSERVPSGVFVESDFTGSTAADNVLIQFDDNSGSPNETFGDTTHSWGDVFVPVSDIANIDGGFDWPAANSRARVGIKLAAGTYRLNLWGFFRWQFRSSSDNVAMCLYKLASGTDVLLAKEDVNHGAANVQHSIGTLDSYEFTVDGTEIVYCAVESQTDENLQSFGFARVEKV